MALRLIAAPQVEPVSLAEAKAHLLPANDQEDAYISSLIAAARGHLDGKDGALGRAIMPQTWELVLDRFPDDIVVPLPPLQSVEFINYVDEDGVVQTLDPSQYTVDAVNEPGWIVSGPNGWPATGDYINAVTVRFTAGYSVVPPNLKAAILLMVGHWYVNREDVVTGVTVAKVPNTSTMLLKPFEVYL